MLLGWKRSQCRPEARSTKRQAGFVKGRNRGTKATATRDGAGSVRPLWPTTRAAVSGWNDGRVDRQIARPKSAEAKQPKSLERGVVDRRVVSKERLQWPETTQCRVANRELGAGCSSRNPCPFALCPARRAEQAPHPSARVSTRPFNWRAFSLACLAISWDQHLLSQLLQWVGFPLGCFQNVYSVCNARLRVPRNAHFVASCDAGAAYSRCSWIIINNAVQVLGVKLQPNWDSVGTPLTLSVPSADWDA